MPGPTDTTDDTTAAVDSEPTPRSVEREIWRELATQGRTLQNVATLISEDHSRGIKMEADMEAIKVATTRTVELNTEMVALTRQQTEIAQRQEDRVAARQQAVDTAAAVNRGKIVDWWVTNWKTIGFGVVVVVVAVVTGNVQPILGYFGITSATPVYVEAPAPAAPPSDGMP
jgi:hypothetical protein